MGHLLVRTKHKLELGYKHELEPMLQRRGTEKSVNLKIHTMWSHIKSQCYQCVLTCVGPQVIFSLSWLLGFIQNTVYSLRFPREKTIY